MLEELLKGFSPDDRLLRPKEAAAYLKLAVQTLGEPQALGESEHSLLGDLYEWVS